MKIRSGFVSNSSTSSFILVGCSAEGLDLTDEEAEKIYEGNFSPVELHSEEELIGIDIASWSDDCGIEEIDLEAIFNKAKKCEFLLKDFFEKRNIPMPKIKIYGGIRSS